MNDNVETLFYDNHHCSAFSPLASVYILTFEKLKTGPRPALFSFEPLLYSSVSSNFSTQRKSNYFNVKALVHFSTRDLNRKIFNGTL